MQTLTFTMPNNLTQLHDELIAGVAGFHRSVGPSDDLAAADDCGSIEASADDIKVTFAGDISAQLITTVVQAHDPTLQQPDSRSRIAEILAIPRSNWTTAQMRELIDLLAQHRVAGWPPPSAPS